MAFADLTGRRFGRLVALRRVESDSGGRTVWECRCDCGTIKRIRAASLTQGLTKSCGCLRHGKSKTRLYHIWAHMIQRCEDPKSNRFHLYGGRGVSVCKEWREDFMNFYSWAVQNGYTDTLSIDRIDVNGNYEPGNCRWATAKKQSNNLSVNRKITFNKVTKTLSEWAAITGIDRRTIAARLDLQGWTVEQALTVQPGKKVC